VDPHRFCVDLHSFCTKDCGATSAKLLILLKAVRVDCGAIGSKLLILLENCGFVWFLEKNEPGCKKAMSDSPNRRSMRVTERLMLFMSLDRSFPVHDCAPEQGNYLQALNAWNSMRQTAVLLTASGVAGFPGPSAAADEGSPPQRIQIIRWGPSTGGRVAQPNVNQVSSTTVEGAPS
jgi:hypothetical protein